MWLYPHGSKFIFKAGWIRIRIYTSRCGSATIPVLFTYWTRKLFAGHETELEMLTNNPEDGAAEKKALSWLSYNAGSLGTSGSRNDFYVLFLRGFFFPLQGCGSGLTSIWIRIQADIFHSKFKISITGTDTGTGTYWKHIFALVPSQCKIKQIFTEKGRFFSSTFLLAFGFQIRIQSGSSLQPWFFSSLNKNIIFFSWSSEGKEPGGEWRIPGAQLSDERPALSARLQFRQDCRLQDQVPLHIYVFLLLNFQNILLNKWENWRRWSRSRSFFSWAKTPLNTVESSVANPGC
jgi:hypothetical protein